MTDKTITLHSELVERLESLAQAKGRTTNDVISELLDQYAPTENKENWALALAEGMEAADIDWLDDPNASENSREHFEQYLREKWRHTQASEAN